MSTVYYIDPTNGSQDNDGLTPSAAFKEFKEGLGDADNHCDFFIRRDSTLVITESKQVQWFSAKRWPTSVDSGYADRPQAGIDAGWDDDADTRPLIQVGAGKHFSWEVANAATGTANLYELDFEFTSTSESLLFSGYALQSTVENVNIRGDQSLFVMYKFSGATPDDNVEAQIVLTNVDINNTAYDDGSNGNALNKIIYLANSGHIKYHINVAMNNFKMRGIKGFAYLHQGANETRNINITVVDSDIEVGSYGLTWSGPSSSDAIHTDVHIDMVRTKVVSYSGDPIFTLSYADNYFHALYFRAIDCEFYTTSSITYAYCKWYSADTHHNIMDFYARGTVFDATHVINYPPRVIKAQIGKIDIQECTIKNAIVVVNLAHPYLTLRNEGSFVFRDNNLEEVTKIIHSSASYPISVISLRGQSLSGNLTSGKLSGGYVFLEDTFVAKPLTDIQASDIAFDIVSSSVDSIVGKGVSASIEGSRVQSSEFVFGGGASGTAINCHIISDNEAIVDKSSSVVVLASTVSAASPSPGRLLMTNTSYNGEVFDRYLDGIESITKTVTGARDGATKASMVEIKQVVHGGSGFTSDANIAYNGTDTTMTVYIIFSREEVRVGANITLQFIDDGMLKTISPTSIDTDDGTWEDYPSSAVKIKAIFDISNYENIPSGSKIKSIVSISGSPDGGDFAVVDFNIVGA